MSRGKAISIRPRPGRPFSKALVDEEGVPYTVPLFLSLLHKEGKAERTIQENLSMVNNHSLSYKAYRLKYATGLVRRKHRRPRDEGTPVLAELFRTASWRDRLMVLEH